MNGKLEKLSSDSGIPIKEWINKAMEFNKNIMILGDAAEIHLAELKEVFGAGIICPQLAMTYPRASATALLAEEAYHNNKVTGAYELEPFYLRKSQAERLKGIQKNKVLRGIYEFCETLIRSMELEDLDEVLEVEKSCFKIPGPGLCLRMS